MSHPSTSSPWRQLLLLGIFGSILVGIGEWMLHYLPDGKLDEMDMLYHVPLERASIGHFFAVFGAPLYIAGYYALWRIFEPGSRVAAIGLFIFGSLSFMVGATWVGSRYIAAEILQKTAGTDLQAPLLHAYESHYQVLVQALRLFVLGVSVFYAICVLKNRFGMPKWLAIFNPIVLLLVVISSMFWFKPLGLHIMPIAMNVTHFIFFGLVLFFYHRHLGRIREGN